MFYEIGKAACNGLIEINALSLSVNLLSSKIVGSDIYIGSVETGLSHRMLLPTSHAVIPYCH